MWPTPEQGHTDSGHCSFVEDLEYSLEYLPLQYPCFLISTSNGEASTIIAGPTTGRLKKSFSSGLVMGLGVYEARLFKGNGYADVTYIT